MGGCRTDRVVSGAYCFLHKSALNRMGPLGGRLLYGEDVDLSYRLLKGGYETGEYLPDTHWGESTRSRELPICPRLL